MYYIYHIPDVKIGCSTQPYERVSKQGYSDFEVLETHTCIDTASKRELELQKEYGYRVDKGTQIYKIAVSNRKKFTPQEQKRGRETMKKNGFFDDWYKKGNEARKKGVVMLDKHTQEPIKEFDSIADAARYVNKPGKTGVIVAVCKGKKNSIYGYKWKYKP